MVLRYCTLLSLDSVTSPLLSRMSVFLVVVPSASEWFFLKAFFGKFDKWSHDYVNAKDMNLRNKIGNSLVKTPVWRPGEIVQQSRVLFFSLRPGLGSQYSHGGSQPFVTIVQGDLIPSSDLHRCQDKCVAYIYM